MAAAITTTSTTLEGQVLEILNALDSAERTYNVANPTTPVQQISIALDPENASISASLQLGATVGGSAGTISMTPKVYLP